MTKRKRTSPSPVPVESPDAIQTTVKNQKRQCNHRIVAAQKSVVAALRLGAGFERQKHSRRKKTAQSKKDEKGLARLEAEYAVLKGLNIEQVADQHLRKTVGKVKSLKDHEALKDYVDGMRKGSGDAATLNVLARLYKVAAVKQAVDEAVDDLKAIVGASGASQPTQLDTAKRSKKVKAPKQQDDEDMDDEDGDPYTTFSARIAAPSSGEDDSEDSVSDDERPPSIGDSDSEHDPEDDLRADSESEEDSFQGFSEDIGGSSEEALDINGRLATPSDQSGVDVDMDSSSDEAMDSNKAKVKALKNAKSLESTFLPGLSQGYLPGSESEASDLDEAPRKNRRGQRARQKLAELKHGAKAKHLENQGRNQGWDAKRGAVSNDHRGDRRGQKGGRGPQQSGGNAEPIGDKKQKSASARRDDKGELHPSWQAAKLAKERKQIKIDVKAPQGIGKKVIFD